MRWISLLLIGLLATPGVGVAVAGGTTQVRGASKVAVLTAQRSARPELRDIRACAYEVFSRKRGGCTRDQSGQVIYSSQVNCSAALADPKATVRVSMAWSYDGGSIWRNTLVGHGKTVWTTFSLGGPFPLPGGTYRCRLAIGTTSLTTTLKSTGPTGPIVDTAICNRGRSHMHYGNRSCLEDADGRTIAAGGIVCNAAFVHVKGRRAAIRIVDAAGKSVVPKYSFVVGTTLDWGSAWSPSLQTGTYRCQFLLDGVRRAEKSVTIA